MTTVAGIVAQVSVAETWDERVAIIRGVPESFGTSQHRTVYSEIARDVYIPELTPDFAYVYQHADYQYEPLRAAYDAAHALTEGFHAVEADELAEAIRTDPRTLRIFRLLLGLSTQEFAAATALPELSSLPTLTNARVKSIEAGRQPVTAAAQACALVVTGAMSGGLFPAIAGGPSRKLAKPDTAEGWATVREFAESGVPLAMLLHQRHYGGAFRQLLDATSTQRGDLLEDAVEALFQDNGIQFIRTGAGNQAQIAAQFGLTVQPAPDYVVFDSANVLRAILECKLANDGGTARDKAARFTTLRGEAARLGGVPVIAVLAGLGWRRTGDALGPVVRDTDGRVFTLLTLPQMLTTQPFPTLVQPI